MDFPRVEEDLNELWAGHISRIELNLREQRAILYVTVLESGCLRDFEVVLTGIKEFNGKYLSEDDELKDVELTSISSVKRSDGLLSVCCELWTSERTLHFTCRELQAIRFS